MVVFLSNNYELILLMNVFFNQKYEAKLLSSCKNKKKSYKKSNYYCIKNKIKFLMFSTMVSFSSTGLLIKTKWLVC